MSRSDVVAQLVARLRDLDDDLTAAREIVDAELRARQVAWCAGQIEGVAAALAVVTGCDPDELMEEVFS